MTNMSNTMNYTIDFVPFTVLLDKDSRNDMFRLSMWIDDNHGGKYSIRNVIQTASYLNNPMTFMMTKGMCETVWYVVLKDNGKVVCVALYQKGMEITTITTAKDERRKGHATYLLTYLANLFEKHGLMGICPTEKNILPVLAKAGWTPAGSVCNPDGTIDTMPEYVKAEYLRTTGAKPMLPLNDRCLTNVLNFMEYLEKRNAPVPKV